MRLTCPNCGAVCSAEGWSADAEARQCMRIIGELPTEVSKRSLGYLALFRRPGGRGLRWSTALRLLADLQRMVTDPYIQWEKWPARKNPAQCWADAMERVIERPPKRLPLSSHGYLRAIAYETANELDAAEERRRIVDEHAGRYPETEERISTEVPERISAEELRAIAARNFRDRKR